MKLIKNTISSTISTIKEVRTAFNVWAFTLRGKKPWSRGYIEYRSKEIARAIDTHSFPPPSDQQGYGWRIDERIIELPWLFSRLPQGSGSILDAGSTLNHEILLDREPLRSKKLTISTLAPDQVFPHKNNGVSYLFEDLRQCSLKNESFDYVACISTLEHIGLDNTFIFTNDPSKRENTPDTYLLAIREFFRVLKPGGVLYLTVPFGTYQNLSWQQIFDGVMIDKIIREFQPSKSSELYYRYNEGWQLSSRAKCADAIYYDQFISKNYRLWLPNDPSAAQAVACLELVKG